METFPTAAIAVESETLFEHRKKPWEELMRIAKEAITTRRSATTKKIHPLETPWREIDGKGICRFHNYSERGCAKFYDKKGLGTHCPCDHLHCHTCKQHGHRSWDCEHNKST
eukprot:UN11814